jgi:hypothetical protein
MASSRIVSQFGPRLKWHEAKEILTKLIPWFTSKRGWKYAMTVFFGRIYFCL